MNSCACCFETSIGSCIPADGFLTINTQLTPSSAYYYHITDKFGNIFSGSIISEANGTLKIPIIDLPDGLFTPYSGDFILQISTDEDGCEKINFLLASRYDCVQFSVAGKNSNGNIGCPLNPTVDVAHEFEESEFSTEFN